MQILDDYGICCMIGARGVPRLKTTQLARRTTSCALNGTTMAGKLAWSTILRMSRTAVSFNHSRPAVPSDLPGYWPLQVLLDEGIGAGDGGPRGRAEPSYGLRNLPNQPYKFLFKWGHARAAASAFSTHGSKRVNSGPGVQQTTDPHQNMCLPCLFTWRSTFRRPTPSHTHTSDTAAGPLGRAVSAWLELLYTITIN